jgi:hypothetical protein
MNTESFITMFERQGIERIEIPIIQRDYAQGRPDSIAKRIRESFLKVLCRALTHGDRVILDFVYGEIAGCVMTPLDGQQRLTTLFLLHWYVAVRAGVHGGDSDFLQRFTYETRYSSRDFCAKLTQQQPPFPVARISEWIRDQSWFFGTWRHDPTIQSMLVILDDIHDILRDFDCVAAWQMLVRRDRPLIIFHVLPIKDMGLTDDLYIKMNSRGKPLTEFEHFKANFEEIIRRASAEHYREFSRKIDNDWADLFWPLKGDGYVIDDEFMHYFWFVTDVLAHKTGIEVSPENLERNVDNSAAFVYGGSNPEWEANQRFLFDALDCWIDVPIVGLFDNLFTEQGGKAGTVAIYDSVNLFEACCKDYGKVEGRNRKFSLPRTLMLFAVLMHRISRSSDFARRARTVRNLVFASDNEVRLDKLTSLLKDTSDIVESGSLATVDAYNSKQVEEERNKTVFLSAHPELEDALFRLEDHTLNRGSVAAFALDASTFERRAATFLEVFPDDESVPLLEVSAALLACGDYSQRKSSNRFQFGSWRQKDVWRQLFTGTSSSDFGNTADALMRMLDAVGEAAGGPVQGRLRTVVTAYIADQISAGYFDWRYYLVTYDEMRMGDSGLYVVLEDCGMGFDLCMMIKQRMSSYYRDPYLYSIFKRSGAISDVDVDDPWYTGYQTEERWLNLSRSGARLRCLAESFALSPPQDGAYNNAFAEVVKKHAFDVVLNLRIPQVLKNGVLYDTQDRVQIGAALIRDLVEMKPG